MALNSVAFHACKIRPATAVRTMRAVMILKIAQALMRMASSNADDYPPGSSMIDQTIGVLTET
jgi:hypothetical protein